MVKPPNEKMLSGGGIQNDGFETDDADSFELNGVDANANGASPKSTNGQVATTDGSGDDADAADHLRCGLACFSPDSIQKYATKRMFIITFSILGVIQSMSWAYFSATLTTLEKRFRLSSQTAGVVMTGNEVSQIVFSIILSYYGTSGHRPRWIAIGVLISSFACFLLAAPHIFYGSGSTALSYTYSSNLGDDRSFLSSIVSDNYEPITAESELVSDKFRKGIKKYGQPCFPGPHNKTVCSKADENTDYSLLPLILIFLSQFASGIGNILFFTLGGPYLDDNTRKEKLPIVLGITSCFRLIGPTIGYLLASGCLKLFINPLLKPFISSDDPRWIGAWWLGWIILGGLMGIAAFFIALFPRELRPSKGSDTEKAQRSGQNAPPADELVKLSDLPKAIKVLVSNKINVFNTLAGVLYLFSAVGYWTYAPKYLETIFLQSASNSAIISGLMGIAFQAAGLLGSGYLISKYRPSARLLAGWNVAIAFLHAGILLVFTQIGCNPGEIAFGTTSQSEAEGTYWNLTSTCNLDCGCQNNKILPICMKEQNKVYFSPCHAGCEKIFPNGTLTQCSCFESPTATAQLGTCSEGCFVTFFVYLAVTAMIKMLDSTGRIGNTLVGYRCVDKKDRSLSIGISIFLISIFALLPAPIVFGAIIDSVCLIWNKSECQAGRGNCLFYDGERLRYVFNITASVFVVLGGILDCFVWYFVKDLDLYVDQDEKKNALATAAAADDNKNTPKSIKS